MPARGVAGLRAWHRQERSLGIRGCFIKTDRRKLAIMKIAVTATGRDIRSDLDPRFGRAEYFIVVDADSMAYEVVENAQNLNLPQGAGIQAGKTIVENNVDVLISGNCGPKAFKVLNSAGVKVVVGPGGSVIDAVEKYKRGELAVTDAANVDGHWV